jgi:anti-anti-sigma regulatory factor
MAPANPGRYGQKIAVRLLPQRGPHDLPGPVRGLDGLLELQASQEQRRIVVDLSRLSSMDWRAALMLLWVGRVCRPPGRVLVLAFPQPAVARVLEAAGAPKVVAIYGSVRQASASMAVRRPLKHAQS